MYDIGIKAKKLKGIITSRYDVQNIKQVDAKNLFEVVIRNRLFLFSYTTIVAIRDGESLYVCDTKHSKTTTRHINKYLRGKEVQTMTEEAFNRAILVLTNSR